MSKLFEILSVVTDEFYNVDPHCIKGVYQSEGGQAIVYLFDTHKSHIHHYAMFMDRLEYCLDTDYSRDDPIANPIKFLTMTNAGRHSDGLDSDQVRQAMKGWFTVEELVKIEEKAHALQTNLSQDRRALRAAEPTAHDDQARRRAPPRSWSVFGRRARF